MGRDKRGSGRIYPSRLCKGQIKDEEVNENSAVVSVQLAWGPVFAVVPGR